MENIEQVESISVEVDGCEINGPQIRCDFLHIAKEIEHYIELKGQDIEHAVKQIENTMRLLSKDVYRFRKKSFIICTRSPLGTTKIQILKAKFKKKYNSDLEIKSTRFVHRY